MTSQPDTPQSAYFRIGHNPTSMAHTEMHAHLPRVRQDDGFVEGLKSICLSYSLSD
jgi:hypothetical protein